MPRPSNSARRLRRKKLEQAVSILGNVLVDNPVPQELTPAQIRRLHEWAGVLVSEARSFLEVTKDPRAKK